MLKVFGICPDCGFETEISNLGTNNSYQMCQQCGSMYNICGNAKVQGVKLSDDRRKEIIKEIEKQARNIVDNWRYV